MLEALPRRPISGVRVVRPDGTISLGFYGDVQVAGLDRNQIKVKIVNHLRKFLSDEILGLILFDSMTGDPVFENESNEKGVLKRIKPADSDRVFVDESVDQHSTPDGSDDRLKKIEQKLEQLTSRLDGLLETRTEVATKAADAGPVPAAPPSRSVTGAAKETNQERTFARKKGSPPASSRSETERSPFELPEESSPLDSLADELRKAQQALAEKEKMAAQGKASKDDLARARSSFEASRSRIPDAVRKAREHLEMVKAQAVEPEAQEVDPKAQARLSAAQSRLEKARELRQEGKISDEEYLDAEGDYQAISDMRSGQEQSPFAGPRRESDVLKAQLDLQIAEELRSEYLDSPEKPATKDSRPK